MVIDSRNSPKDSPKDSSKDSAETLSKGLSDREIAQGEIHQEMTCHVMTCLKPVSAKDGVARLIFIASICLSLLGGCAQVIAPLSPADSRLPSAAKQRIADAEDAVVIARSRAQDARAALTREQTRIAEFESRPPELGAALSAARQLNSARLARADLESQYATAELALSESRLTLIYAQTSLRYDLAVYDLTPLDTAIEARRATLLKLRRELKGVRADVRERRSAWWTAYQQLARSGGTQPYWVHEFSR